jgi:CheY-like chemotaxis protein
LEAAGIIPIAASSGQEALDLIDSGLKADFALLDMMMPEMDGLALAGKIHERKNCAGLPILVLTSIGQKSGNPHVRGFLSKPIRLSLLKASINSLFREGQKDGASGAVAIDTTLGQRFPLKILVAEDNPVNQKVVMRTLGRMGYSPSAASNGRQVIDALEREAFDLILMDVQMPEMDGLEATRLIKRDRPGGQSPRIIAMTAYAMEDDREICLSAGMDDYISKPVRISELQSALERSSRKIKGNFVQN